MTKHWLYDRAYEFDGNWTLEEKRKKIWSDLWFIIKVNSSFRWLR